MFLSQHLLAAGKTLTAFLWAINKLLTGSWQKGALSVLYISPLKALNKDVTLNLLTPISELEELFKSRETVFPKINVVTRSGDTTQSNRRRMITHPPEILITTPESLNLLISSINARPVFNALKTVILDEIHAIVSSKRGTHLITAVDRLILLAAAVMSRCILDKAIEKSLPVLQPLDMLAQVILSMTCMQTWNIDDLFIFLRSGYPYHKLSRSQFKIVSIDQKKLEVIPWQGKINTLPFRKADLRNAGFHFQEKAALFLEKWSGKIDSTAFKETLARNHCMSESATTELISYLKLQTEATEPELPHRHHMVIEYCSEGTDVALERRCIIHTLWGSKINHPLLLAISAYWEKTFGHTLEVFSDNFCIILLIHNEFDMSRFFSFIYETWRSCVNDEFDLQTLYKLLD